MANTNITRRSFTDLSEPQQIRELNRQMEWIWHQLLGGLTEKAMSSVGIKQTVKRIETTVAKSLQVDDISANAITAALGEFMVAQIAVAQIDLANINDLQAAMASFMVAYMTEANINWAGITRLSANIADIVSASIQSASITSAQISDLSTEVARIVSAQISSATISSAQISDLNATVALIFTAAISQASISSAQITDLNTVVANIVSAAILNASISSAQISDLSATVANILAASIQNATIDVAQIRIGSTDTAFVRQGVGGELYIDNLAVSEANIVNLAAGTLLLNDSQGNLVRLYIDGNGDVQTEAVAYDGDDIINSASLNGSRIIDGSITTEKLNATSIFAVNGTIMNLIGDRIDATRIRTGTLDASMIQGGMLTLGGANNVNGQMQVKDASGNVAGSWNKDGIAISKGSVVLTYTSGTETRQLALSDSQQDMLACLYQGAYTDTSVSTDGQFLSLKDNNSNKRLRMSPTSLTLSDGGVVWFIVSDSGSVKSMDCYGDGYFSGDLQVDGDVYLGNELPVSQGGTGARTAAGARANLNITPANIGAAAADTHRINFYSNPSQLGLSGNSTVLQIFQALPDNSVIVTAEGLLASDMPNGSAMGQLMIWRGVDSRTFIQFFGKVASRGTWRMYLGATSYNGNNDNAPDGVWYPVVDGGSLVTVQSASKSVTVAAGATEAVYFDLPNAANYKVLCINGYRSTNIELVPITIGMSSTGIQNNRIVVRNISSSSQTASAYITWLAIRLQ